MLNEAREKLETIIIRFCKSYGFSRPRMYRRQARKNYLALAKAKKRSTKKIRAIIRKQLAYIKRDIGYLESRQPGIERVAEIQGAEYFYARDISFSGIPA